MGLFGSTNDINLFRGINRELIDKIINQRIGYYKIQLDESPSNIYGENVKKMYDGPYLVNCIIERADQGWSSDDFGPDVDRTMTFNVLRDDLVEMELLPEVGDVILYVDEYYEVNSIIENEYIVGKTPDYFYGEGDKEFGASWNMKLVCHMIPADKLGISKERL